MSTVNRRRECMIDIESMDVIESASILTIGAVMFDSTEQDTEESIRERTDDHFYAKASLESNMAEGRTVSASTIMWWLDQDKAAQESLKTGDITNLRQMLTKLKLYLAEKQPVRIWANSPNFDLSIIKHAYRQLGMRWDWMFYIERDVRTIKDLAYPENDAPKIGVGTAHDALDDSIRQALLVQHCTQKIHSAMRKAGE